MKTWNQLTAEEQSVVRTNQWGKYIKGLLEIGPDLIGESDHPTHQRFLVLEKQMERMQTPWFLGETLFHDPEVGGWIKEEVEEYIKEAMYLESGEIALHIPFIKKVTT